MGKANDWFLVAPDFTDYMRAQVCEALVAPPIAKFKFGTIGSLHIL